MPARPVAQLAFPEFTMTARTRPPAESNDARPTSTGAAMTRFFVNKAAALAPLVASASARSGRPLTLMPAARAANENPKGKRIFSGERRGWVMPEYSNSSWAAARSQMREAFRGSSRFRRSDRAAGTDNSLYESCREDPDDSRQRIPYAR